MELKFKTTDTKVGLCWERSFIAECLVGWSEWKSLAPVTEVFEDKTEECFGVSSRHRQATISSACPGEVVYVHRGGGGRGL